MQEAIDRLRAEGLSRIEQADTPDALGSVRIDLLGRKGELTGLLRGLKDVPADERPAAGAALNRLKQDLTAAFEARVGSLAGQTSTTSGLDLTLPGRARVAMTLDPDHRLLRRHRHSFIHRKSSATFTDR